MSLQDENMRAIVAALAGQRIMTTVVHFRRPNATWENHPFGGDEAWLEMLKTDLMAVTGQVQERINAITVSAPQEFG
jgi:hypothetical protein